MRPSINEVKIKEIKSNLRQALPKLSSAVNYLLNNPIADALGLNLSNHENLASLQLVLPMLSLLGYEIFFKDGHLEVWSESALGAHNKAEKVDYAIFINPENPVPRAIIEVKAISKIDKERNDYGTAGKQADCYYQKKRDAIYLAIVTNGEKYWLLKRKQGIGNEKQLAASKEDEKFEFTLNNLYSEEKLDLFVRLASRPVIAAFAISNCSTEDYDSYVNETLQNLKLRQTIAEKCLDLSADLFERFYANKPESIKSDILTPAGRNKDINDFSRANKKTKEENYNDWLTNEVALVCSIYKDLKKADETNISGNVVTSVSIEPINSTPSSVVSDEITKHTDYTINSNNTQPENSNNTTVEQDTSKQSNISKQSITTEIELKVLDTIKTILSEVELKHELKYSDDSAGNRICFFLDDRPQEQINIEVQRCRSWVVGYGGQHDINNGCLVFNPKYLGDFNLDGYPLEKYETESTRCEVGRYPRFLIHSFEDILILKDVLIHCFQAAD